MKSIEYVIEIFLISWQLWYIITGSKLGLLNPTKNPQKYSVVESSISKVCVATHKSTSSVAILFGQLDERPLFGAPL